MNDLDAQDHLRGQIMARLLAGGVRRQEWSSEDFENPYAVDEFDDLFCDMLIWLRDEGLARYETLFSGENNETCVAGIVASSRAASFLDEKVAGDKTARDLISGPKESNADRWGALGSFFGGFVGGFVQSAG